MSIFQHEITRHTKRQNKTHFEEKYHPQNQTQMTQILELLDKEFKITVINMLGL